MRLRQAGLAAVGLALAHTLQYWFVTTDEAIPTHSGMHLVWKLGAVAVLSSIVGEFSHRRRSNAGIREMFLWVLCVQLTAFFIIEIAERAVVALPLGDLPGVLAWGSLIQAAIAAALCMLAQTASNAIERLMRPRSVADGSRPSGLGEAVSPTARPVGVNSARGPPVFV